MEWRLGDSSDAPRKALSRNENQSNVMVMILKKEYDTFHIVFPLLRLFF
ncbi:hypothetical protein [Lysinibacillus sp. TE18511]